MLSDIVGSDLETVFHNVVCNEDMNIYIQTTEVLSEVEDGRNVD